MISDPRCAGFAGSAFGAGRTFCAAKGVSPPGFCGASRRPESPALDDEPMGDENAASDEPMIMAINMSNIC